MTKNNEQMHCMSLSVELDKSHSTATPLIIDDCICLDKWKHCDICEKLIKTKDGANGKKREHLLVEEDLRCDFYPNCYYKQLKRAMNQIVELNKKAEAKEQECKELTTKYSQLEEKFEKAKGLAMLRRKCLEAVKELTKNANLPNISLYIDSFLNEEPQKINEVIDEK